MPFLSCLARSIIVRQKETKTRAVQLAFRISKLCCGVESQVVLILEGPLLDLFRVFGGVLLALILCP